MGSSPQAPCSFGWFLQKFPKKVSNFDFDKMAESIKPLIDHKTIVTKSHTEATIDEVKRYPGFCGFQSPRPQNQKPTDYV